MLGCRSVAVAAVCAALCACAGNAATPEATPSDAQAGAGAAEAGAVGSDRGAGSSTGSASAGGGGTGGAVAASTAGSPAPAAMGGANAGAASSTGTTSAGSLPPPDPSVTFDWPATLPGGDDGCRPGHYDGTFSCEYRLAPTDVDPIVVVEGPISLTLERSQDGEFLEISDGQLEGIAQLIIGFRSKLSGKLDCATHELTADAVDGLYGFGDPAALPFGAFAGTLTGTLDATTGALEGEWDLGVDASAGGGACVGPWQANWAP